MTTYTDPFGGGTIQPSPVAFAELTLTALSTRLVWPGYDAGTSPTAAQSMDIISSIASAVVLLPPANVVSVGASILLTNRSANSVAVQDAAGGAIATLAAGQARLIYLTSNSTVAGSWRTIQYGVGTGALDVGSAAGYGLNVAGLTLQSNWPVSSVSASFSVLTSMRASTLAWTGGTGTATLPATSTAGNGFGFAIRNQGTGILTLNAGAETIDGASTVALQPQESALVYTNGAGAWYTLGRGRNQQFNFTLLIKGITGGTVTLSTTEAANIVQRYTGVLVSNAEIVLPSVVQVYYVSNQTSGAFTVTFRTSGVGTTVSVPSGQNAVLFCDGLNVINNSTTVSGLTSLLLSAGSVTAPSLAYSGDTSTGVYRPVAGSVGVAGLGVDVARFTGVASGVNYLQFTAAVSGAAPSIAAQGADANINITLTPKGTGIVSFGGGAFGIPDGTAAAPGLAFTADTNTGIYRIAADTIGLSTNGTLRVSVSTTELVSTLPMRNADGTAGAPAYAFSASTSTGMYSSGVGALDFAAGGTRALAINATRDFGVNCAPVASIAMRVQASGFNDVGVELARTSATNINIQAYDRTGAAYRTLTLDGSSVIVNSSGAARYTFDTAAITPAATNTYNLGASGSDWATIFARNLFRDTAGDLILAATNAAGRIDLRVAGNSGLLIDSNRKSTFGGGAFTTTVTVAYGVGTPTFDANLSNVFELGTMTGNVSSCTITNPSNGQTIQIRVKQDGTGGRTFASPAGAKIAGSVGAVANAASILTLTYSAADARWEGSWLNLPA